MATPETAPGASPNPIVSVSGGEAGLPPGLTISGPMFAELLPDGRLHLLDLPPDLEARLYPDLAAAPDPEPEPTQPIVTIMPAFTMPEPAYAPQPPFVPTTPAEDTPQPEPTPDPPQGGVIHGIRRQVR